MNLTLTTPSLTTALLCFCVIQFFEFHIKTLQKYSFKVTALPLKQYYVGFSYL